MLWEELACKGVVGGAILAKRVVGGACLYGVLWEELVCIVLWEELEWVECCDQIRSHQLKESSCENIKL